MCSVIMKTHNSCNGQKGWGRINQFNPATLLWLSQRLDVVFQDHISWYFCVERLCLFVLLVLVKLFSWLIDHIKIKLTSQNKNKKYIQREKAQKANDEQHISIKQKRKGRKQLQQSKQIMNHILKEEKAIIYYLFLFF